MFELNLSQTIIDGRYEIRGRISAGSYAEVFIAHDLLGGNTVVIKALNTLLQGSPSQELDQMLFQKFEGEAAILKHICHLNIVSILGQGEAEDRSGRPFPFILLEFMAGGNLLEQNRTRPNQRLTLAETLYYFKQVCEGLAHAHECGVIHRDLKPENLLLSADWRTIKIADFGVAKANAAQYSPITRVGTPNYSAPEHSPYAAAENLGTLTASADIYALAKTCFAVLSGRVPTEFLGKTITALPCFSEKQPWVSECVRILQRATAHEVNERYGSVAEFWNDLAALATLDPAVTKAIPFKRPTPEESELVKKRAELAPLEAILAQREAELATLQAELRDFEARYLRIVGPRYAELDELEAQIAEAIARLDPRDEHAQSEAERARSQADESAEASQSARHGSETCKFAASEVLKKLRREAARLIHPDTVLDEREKERHHQWMARVNEAFDNHDEQRLRELLNQWESSPDSVKGEGIAVDLVRVIRKIALVEQRLKIVNDEILSLKRCDLYELKSRAEEAEVEGRDLFQEMAFAIQIDIDEARDRLEEILRTRLAI